MKSLWSLVGAAGIVFAALAFASPAQAAAHGGRGGHGGGGHGGHPGGGHGGHPGGVHPGHHPVHVGHGGWRWHGGQPRNWHNYGRGYRPTWHNHNCRFFLGGIWVTTVVYWYPTYNCYGYIGPDGVVYYGWVDGNGVFQIYQ